MRNGDSRRPPLKKGRLPVIPVVLVGAAIVGVVAWHFLSQNKTPTESASAPAPTAVNVQTITQQKLRLWSDFSGRLRAVDAAEIRPEVSGRITEVRFRDGQSVEAGEILFVIDPRPFEAAVARAEARIATAKANVELTAANQARNRSLLGSRVISQREFDQTNSANNAAAAEVVAAQADLKTAEIDLDHAHIKAPISGRVSRAELTVGNLVQSGAGAPLLASIVSEDGIYADFEVDEQTYLKTIRDSANGNAQEGKIPVELVIRVDAERVYSGFIQNFDNRLSSESGTIRARARFENTDRALVPGMFVSVRLASSTEKDLVLVDDRAISFDQSKTTVLAVNPDNKVAYREIKLGASLVGKHVVLKGLRGGDRVIVDGVQRVHPGDLVNPKEYDPDGGTTSSHKDTKVAKEG